MSFDLNLTTACDHLVYKELSLLDSTAKILRPDKPIAITATLKLYATENLVPQNMYTIINDPQPPPIGEDRLKVIRFKSKWRSPRDYFQICYQTLSGYCAKCAGTNYLDDITYDVRGDAFTIRNERLLMQNVEKFVVTTLGSNAFHDFIGTSLINLIGSRISSVSFLSSQITSEISRTLQKFQSLQSQYKATGRAVTDGEMLQSINSINVTQDVNDPTIFNADVSVSAVSGKTVEFTQRLKVVS